MDGKNAERSEEITEEVWNEVNEFNREMVQDYLDNQTELSVKTKKVYESGIKIFFVWVKDHLKNKSFLEIKKKEFAKYLNWLTNRGLSDSAIKFKKSCASAFCNYVMMMYEDEYPTFRNFTIGIKVVKTGYVHEKVPFTPDEYVNLCRELEKREEWQKLAYLVFSYSTGCRRAEAMCLALRSGFQNGNINLLNSETEIDEKLQKLIKGFNKLSDTQKIKLRLPYYQTTFLIEELINLDHEVNNGLIKVKEKSGMRKDRYSSLEYNYYVVQELALKLKPKNTDMKNLADILPIRTAKRHSYFD